MDAVTLTTQDHRTVEDLFSRFEDTDDPGQKRSIMDEIIEQLSIHAAIEEEILYPVMRELPEGESLVAEAIEEHLQAKVALALLARLEPDHPRFDDKARELIGDVRHHVEEEEQELLPKLRDAVDSERLEELGQQLEEAKASAPTRPGPEDLAKATTEQLYEAARVIDLTDRSEMNKDDLVRQIAPM